MNNSIFPKIDIPDFQKLSKNKLWDPRRYQPMVYNARVKNLSETLKPGTLEYDDFWDEMDYYCIHGIEPKGMPRITGRHFYYLNFTLIEAMPPGSKRKRLMSPFYRDLDHWLFLEYEGAETWGYGLIIGKPRRVGLSEWGSLNVNYDLTFHSRAKAGIAAGKEDKAAEFYQKLQSSLENTHKAYRNFKLIGNDEEMLLAYTDTVNKQKVKQGLQSLARIKTMFADTGAFEGGSYSICIFEEAGLFQNLQHSFTATKPCFMEGAQQFGVPLVYGTGGEIDKGAKGYKELWDNHEVHNLKKLFIPAYFYYPGDSIPDEETGKSISFFDYTKGVTNREAAKKFIEAKRKIASRSKDTYIKHIQSYPLTESEIFIKSKGGTLDLAKLQFQLKDIFEGNAPEPVLRGRMEWIDTPQIEYLLNRAKNTKERTKIRIENECKVKFVADDVGPIWIDSQPINPQSTHMSYKPDIGGCDSYDEEGDDKNNSETLSSGCVMAYRTFCGPTKRHNKPVGVLVERGDASFDDDAFYENAVKFAVFWDMEILFEYSKIMIIRYFYDVGAGRFVKGRPDILEAGTDKHKNKDGIKMTKESKPVLTKCLKSEVRDNIHKNYFENIIMDLMKYGDGNTDIAMTLGLCLLHKMDMFGEITDGIEYDYQNGNGNFFDDDYSYYVDINGNLRINGDNSNEVKIGTFIPERDLDKNQYEEYVAKINAPDIAAKKRQTEHEKMAEELGLDQDMLSMILQERNRLSERNE